MMQRILDYLLHDGSGDVSYLFIKYPKVKSVQKGKLYPGWKDLISKERFNYLGGLSEIMRIISHELMILNYHPGGIYDQET